MRQGLTAIAVILTLACAGGSHAAAPAADDPEANLISELVVVAPAQGPAWWKASKGDAVVWIMGLPAETRRGLKWDQRTLKRRLKGARMLIGPAAGEPAGIDGGLPPALPLPIAQRVVAVAERQGLYHPGQKRLGLELFLRFEPVENLNIVTVTTMRWVYQMKNRLGLYAQREVYAAAKRAGVPIVTPPKEENRWLAADLSPTDPAIIACVNATLDYVETPVERFQQTAAAWAVGDVAKMLETAPRSVAHPCRKLWSASWDRTIDFQTRAIAEALEKPGKVVAIAPITQLVAADGVLVRLRAQGYTIADPARPLLD